MKITVLLFLLIAVCRSSPVVLYREVAPGEWLSENVTNDLTGYTISEKDIKIYFRSQSNPTSTIPVDLTKPKEVNKDGYSNEKDTVFIIHGWRNEFDSAICEEISEAVLKVKDANVFVVDWSKIAKNLYIIAKAGVPQVGKVVSRLIKDLVNDNGLDLKKTFIVGHSLGAHVAGLCGAALEGKVNHIVGLDPALPLFKNADIDDRLDITDAQFVQVIHTCSGLLGFNRALGHVDYWPNGGFNQPGCGGIFDLGGHCSHGRSYKYFAESIVSGGFFSHRCDNYHSFKSGECSSDDTSLMGQYYPDEKANGSYYLTTNSHSPFARN